MRNNVSPTVFRRRVSDHAYGAWLMEHATHHHPTAAPVQDRPGFVASYWDAIAEAHPVAADVIGLAVWYTATILAGAAILGAMVWVRI